MLTKSLTNSIKTLCLFSLLISTSTVDGQRIKFSQTLIDPAIEGKTYPISVTIDEPIICTNMDIGSVMDECRMTVIFDNPAPDTLSISPCFIEWSTRNWHETRTVQLRLIGHFRNVADRDVKLVAQPAISKSEYYSGFVPNPITVRFRSLNTATCSSTGDPHYSTFDGYYFHFYGRGKSVLAHVPGELEVQTITQGDGYSRNCAIAISEGGNYVALSVCSGNGNIQPLTIFKDLTATPKVISYSGTNYQVDYPSGLSVKFQAWGNNANVYLTLPGRYYKHPQLYGLCGNWNGNQADEGIPSYIMWEWANLNPKHQVISGSDMDLFTAVGDAKVMRTYNNADQAFLTAVKATCDYVPPVYVRPILNNPNAEDITELIKQLTIAGTKNDDGINFIIVADDSPNTEYGDDDVINAQPINAIGPTREELEALCKVIGERSELANCIDLTKRHISNCISDLNLFENIMVVQESLESARTECLQQQLIKTVDDTQANVIINNICIANCPIYSKCVDNQCVCTDSGMKGPLCSIPVNAMPAFNDIKPRVVDIYDWKKQNAEQIMFSLATRYIMPDDKLQCIVNDVAYPANYMSETNVYCRLPISALTAVTENTGNITIYLQVNSYIITTPQYIASYNNPCILCDPNGYVECTRRTEQTCFPKGFKRFVPLVHGIGMTQQSCSRPSIPCQYCINDTTRVDWFSDSSCMPYFIDKNINVRLVEDMDIHLEAVNLSSYIHHITDANNNLWFDNLFIGQSSYPYWRIRTGDYYQNISYTLDCQDMFSTCVFQPILIISTITESLLYNIFLDLMISTTVIDTLNYNLLIINNKDNDPITTSDTTTSTTNTHVLESTTATDTSTESSTIITTSVISHLTSSITTTTLKPTTKQTTVIRSTEPITEIVYTTFDSTTIITSTSTVTYIATDEPVIVQGVSNQESSLPAYVLGIIGAFALMIMIISALMYQSRYRKQQNREDRQDAQFMLDYKTTSDKALSFINPLFVKPEYMEIDPGLINPLYNAMMNMSEGTYKIVCTEKATEKLLIVRGVNDGVETYPIRQRDNKVILNNLYNMSEGIAFDSVDSMISYYSTTDTPFPLTCNLTRVCPKETYSYVNVYSYNNTNIKNTPISVEAEEC